MWFLKDLASTFLKSRVSQIKPICGKTLAHRLPFYNPGSSYNECTVPPFHDRNMGLGLYIQHHSSSERGKEGMLLVLQRRLMSLEKARAARTAVILTMV